MDCYCCDVKKKGTAIVQKATGRERAGRERVHLCVQSILIK